MLTVWDLEHEFYSYPCRPLSVRDINFIRSRNKTNSTGYYFDKFNTAIVVGFDESTNVIMYMIRPSHDPVIALDAMNAIFVIIFRARFRSYLPHVDSAKGSKHTNAGNRGI